MGLIPAGRRPPLRTDAATRSAVHPFGGTAPPLTEHRIRARPPRAPTRALPPGPGPAGAATRPEPARTDAVTRSVLHLFGGTALPLTGHRIRARTPPGRPWPSLRAGPCPAGAPTRPAPARRDAASRSDVDGFGPPAPRGPFHRIGAGAPLQRASHPPDRPRPIRRTDAACTGRHGYGVAVGCAWIRPPGSRAGRATESALASLRSRPRTRPAAPASRCIDAA